MIRGVCYDVLRYEGQIDDAEQEKFDDNRKPKCGSDLAPHSAVTHNSFTRSFSDYLARKYVISVSNAKLMIAAYQTTCQF